MDDLRESPAVEVARLLAQAGAQVSAFEPYKPGASIAGVECMSSLQATLAEAEMIVLLVRHSEFLGLSPGEVAEMTPARLVFDAVNAWKWQDWQSAGFCMLRLGVGA